MILNKTRQTERPTATLPLIQATQHDLPADEAADVPQDKHSNYRYPDATGCDRNCTDQVFSLTIYNEAGTER